MLDITNEPLALREAVQGCDLATVWAFRAIIFDPCSETFLTCDFAAGGAHFGLLERLEADVTVEE